MAVAVATPRDRLQRLLDYGLRARRYWWIVAAFVVVGGALSVGFALMQKPLFQSSASLFYQERIQTSLLQGRDAAAIQRNIGERYRELLLARSQLIQIIEDPELNPLPDVVEDDGPEAAVEELRLLVDFQVRGNNTFRISYKDVDPERAQKVTQRLTELLIDKETQLRLEQGTATVKFAEETLEAARSDLDRRVQDRAAFLYKHPEFAEAEQLSGQAEGAAILRREERPAASGGGRTSNPRLSALERQRARIRARLSAANNPNPTPRAERTPSATESAARRRVESAEDEIRQATRELEGLRGRGLTDNHPDVRKAKDTLQYAQSKLKHAEAELAAAQAGVAEPVAPPANANERAALERELSEVEAQMAAERRRPTQSSSGAAKPPEPDKNDVADKVVQLEAEWARVDAAVDEQRERVQSLNDSVFRAQLDAQTRIAEQGTALQVVDPAYLPKKPTGKGKKMLVMAGLVVFTGLGMALAIALAIVDDRLYRRTDIEQLEVAPVLAVIPKARGKRARKGRVS